MRLLSWLLCAAAAIVPATSSEEKSISRPKRDSSEKKIVCYYTNWSVYRPGTAKFSPQNINPYLCTHLIYAFGGLSKENALKPFDKYQDIEQGGYAKFNGLKTYNRNLKTMLAIGGWNEGSARFSPLVADAERRKELVKNTVKFLRQNHFDGLDLDWEYPSFRDGGKPRDRDNYATLVQEFREEFERESEKTGRTRLILTMAVPAGIEYIDKGYDVPKLNKYLDWMNILSYDYHSAFEPTINHHSPLFSLEEDDEYNFDAQLSIDYTIQHYIKLGADKSKLVLGIPTYGRSYTLFNPDATDIGSPADGPGEQGEATREKGYLAYYEICERVKSGGWSVEKPNPEAMGPFAYKDNQWVGYDDEDIARAKAKYVNDNDLGGIMFWSIDNDDFRGKCHGKPYPIIEAAKESLLASANELVPSSRSSSSRSSSKKDEESSVRTKTRKNRVRAKSTTTTESSKPKSSGRTTTTPQPPTTPDPGSDFVCKDEGFFPHPRDCKKYFWCLDSGPSSLGIVAHQFTCPSGLVFNKISDSCDYARNVICKVKSETTTTTTSTTTTTTTTPRTTTARSRSVITASPPRTPRTTTTTTTTTEQPEEEELEEDEEEDPGTIKELINLIKKLGGVEQLEKQLNLQNSDEKEKIKPSLYSRVLQGRTGNRYRGVNEEPSTPKYVSVFRNRPVGPQSPSIDETSTTARASDKPRYVTIQRNRPTITPSKAKEETEEQEKKEEEVEEPEQPKRKEETPKPFRRRPNNDATTEKEYVTLRRARPQKDEEISTPKYKNIIRVRSTTEAAGEEEEDEEEEEKEEEKEEEDVSEEEEAVEEEQEPEPGQKTKKYSAIVRDNKKIVPEEEELKVSGPQGPHYNNGAPSSTTSSAFEEKDYVNNVYRVTSPKYVEIRRTQTPSLESTGSDVNSVNNIQKNDENSNLQEETNEVSEKEHEINENGFQRRITTEVFKRSTRPLTKLTTVERTTPASVEPTNTGEEVSRFRGRILLRPTTESLPSTEFRFTNRYKTLNRHNADEPVSSDQNETNKLPKREKTFKTSTTTSTTTPNSNGAVRRFQFAPRTKPTILSSKPFETTTQGFTITIPDLPDSSLTENVLGFSFNSQFPSATVEPATATSPSDLETTLLDVTENDVFITLNDKKLPLSTRRVIPTTSTLTSVVTSITESSFTERKKISVPKKARFRSELGSRYNTFETTTEEKFETTKPYTKYSGYKTIVRSTTQSPEIITASRRRNFKTKTTTTTTTTEEPEVSVKKFTPKKTRSYKKIVSTEEPEIISSTTQRYRYQSRNKPKENENGQNNSLFSRFNSARRKKKFSKKEEVDDDDLEVEQTATFFGDDVDNNNRYILSGGVKQTSKKDYLNADVFFITVPTVEEEEKSAKAAEELTNLVELNKVSNTATQINKTESKELVRSRFITKNSNLRNLRSRTRPPFENVKEEELRKGEETEKLNVTRSSFQIARNNTTGRSNFYKPNSNLQGFRNLRARNQENGNEKRKNTVQEDRADLTEVVEKKESSRNKSVNSPTSRTTTYRFNRNRTPIINKNDQVEVNSTGEVDRDEPLKFNFYTPDPNLNFKSTKIGAQQTTEIPIEGKVSSIDSNNVDQTLQEPIKNNLVSSNFGKSRGRLFSRTSEATTEAGSQANNFQRVRGRTTYFDNSIAEKTTEGFIRKTDFSTSSRSSKAPTTLSSSAQSRYRSSRTRTGTITTPGVITNFISETDDLRIPTLNDVTVTTPKVSVSVTQGEKYKSDYDDNDAITNILGSTPFASTYGVKVGAVSSTPPGLLNGSTPSSISGVSSSVKPGLTTSFRSASTSRSGSTSGFVADSLTGSSIQSSVRSKYVTENTKDSTKTTQINLDSTVSKVLNSKSILNDVTEPSPVSEKKEFSVKAIGSTTFSSSNFRTLRGRTRFTTDSFISTPVPENSEDPISSNILPLTSSQSNFSALRNRSRGKVSGTESLNLEAGKALNESVEGENRNGKSIFPKGRRKVLVRARPVQSTFEPKEKEEDNELESLEDPPTNSKAPARKGTQEYFNNLRTRGRSTTQSPVTSERTERTERRRIQLDRRRLRTETRASTLKAEVQTEIPSTSPRSNILLRRRPRPTTSTTTTTTTEETYVEQQEDSRLEESKSLDETPDIQDLADPAVVAIHNLATVSPGPIAPVVTASLNSYSQTPATYTVHVTPSDIASFTTSPKISPVTSGSVSSRPTSILTLKPFTVPLITKQFLPNQTPIPIRTPSPFRGTGISVVTEEPYSPRSEVLLQSRRQEATPKTKSIVSVSPTVSGKETAKSRRVKPFSKVPKQEVIQSVSSAEPPVDYEYYDEDEDPLANIPASALKVKVHSDGYIECLDRGNFPHPFSCKKFISCAKMENNELLGWEYTCPKHLSFDPVGGICNWSAGLGCQH